MVDTYRIVVEGHVQGVCFRATTKQIARKLGLKGLVKNLSDGSVEILVQGSQNDAQQLLNRLAADKGLHTITNAKIELYAPKNPFTSFEIVF